MKLCKDCVYRKRDLVDFILGIFSDFSKCHAPQNLEVTPVTGRTKYRSWKFCEGQRLDKSDNKSCSPDAAWFKPKKPKH